MSSAGVVEHLDKTPERWAFLLRAPDGTAANVELRGTVVGTLADGHEIELLESRMIAADAVIVARRLRNVTLSSMVTARQPGRGSKVVAFLVPQSIWTPIGGIGAAVFGYVTAGATEQSGDPPDATATPTVTAAPTAPPAAAAERDGFPVVAVVLAALVLIVAITFLVRRGDEPEPPPPPRARSGGRAAWFAFVVVAGLIVGVGLNLVIT